MKPIYSAPAFKVLKQEWYAKLKESGFTDIEDSTRAQSPLKAWHDRRFKNATDIKVQTSRAYYDRATSLLHTGRFKDKTHRRIWELHCEGLSTRKISEILSQETELTAFRYVKVGYIIQEIGLQMSEVTIRAFDPDTDSAIIYDSWPKGVYYGRTNRIRDSKHLWFKEFFEQAQVILARAKVYVACMGDDPSTIFGYSIVDGDTLEFVYVKGMMRKQGIATLLVKNKGIKNCRNVTRAGRMLLEKYPEWSEV